GSAGQTAPGREARGNAGAVRAALFGRTPGRGGRWTDAPKDLRQVCQHAGVVKEHVFRPAVRSRAPRHRALGRVSSRIDTPDAAGRGHAPVTPSTGSRESFARAAHLSRTSPQAAGEPTTEELHRESPFH